MSIKVRLLKITDLKKNSGLWETLNNLSPVGKFSYIRAQKAFKDIIKQNSYNYVAVEERNKQIVGNIKLIIEQKLYRNFGRAGHIEDVVVHKDYEGQGIAKLLINTVIKKAKELKCYKLILDCSPELVSFYSKFGLEEKERGMKMYLIK
ncbi:MAG: GNAT family N-acetyltransferase [Planctomycetes bacterium]|jgi:glucosamine-phosphate N-acetyltransferase|nr:GNAT family N-acetyltransferase [Planctomycetota bacterium]